jgi:NAD(P)-dependent dehydrogenase (short-subunit alcohol dehydrogenase family)
MHRPLEDQVAVVAGATRGAGRGIACELGAAGATVYVTGRSTEAARSPMDRPETIEGTAAMVVERGGTGIPVLVDHTRPEEVSAFFDRVRHEQSGRLDVLVNDIWGGDPLAEWGKPFWEQDLEKGLRMQQLAVTTHIITSRCAVPLMITRRRGLVVEVTDGVDAGYRGNFFYDLAKSSVIRLAVAQAAELAPHNVTAVALTPGFLRSEAVLDHFGVREDNWREAIAIDRHFAASETPFYVGRAVVALAADPEVMAKSGQGWSSWGLAREYGFKDVDGSRPDWGTYFRENLSGDPTG